VPIIYEIVFFFYYSHELVDLTKIRVGVYRNHLIGQLIQMSRQRNSSLTDNLILMKPYTVTELDLRICMKEDNSDPNYFKGDN